MWLCNVVNALLSCDAGLVNQNCDKIIKLFLKCFIYVFSHYLSIIINKEILFL